ncbi:MAG: hypothetical protein ACQEQU_09140 [Spirochaetota bacterium]
MFIVYILLMVFGVIIGVVLTTQVAIKKRMSKSSRFVFQLAGGLLGWLVPLAVILLSTP